MSENDNSLTTGDWLKKYQEAAQKLNAQHACPNCGYCPHCGRGGYRTYPYYPVYPPWAPPYITWCDTITTGTVTVTNG